MTPATALPSPLLRVRPAGSEALLAELPDLAHTLALHRWLQAQSLPGVRAVVPAARTLLVEFDATAVAPHALAAQLHACAVQMQAPQAAHPEAAGRLVEIPVHYTGADLPEVAELMGVSVAEVIARHTGQPWQAAFAGFAPGFVYLTGGHPSFDLPRRSTPRTRVPAGAVALAGAFSAVYPAASPGGWQLIGVTELPLWDLQRPEPAYVQPGFRVQFRDAGAARVHPGPPRTDLKQKTPPAPVDKAQAAIEIVAPGLQTLVQDGGRHGMAAMGVSASGALDLPAMRQANRRVGNPAGAPVLENLLGGLQLRCHGRATLAVSGAPAPLTLHDAAGRAWPLPGQGCVALDDGDTLHLGAPASGVRCYVAVRGGWQVEPVLGSCATDTLAHLGPPALQAGQRLAVGQAVPAGQLQAVQPGVPEPAPLPRAGETVTLDVLLGPRTDWFAPEALALLTGQPWQVTAQSNRVGLRLAGAQPLPRCRTDELPSEGTVTGALQVPASGQPVLFLADHPLTGGYPVIGAVARHHLGLAAQIPVGARLRFRVIAPYWEEVFP
ncbi:5-oxoprolinase/urea amidolyase family protein [Comamonas granuli]|uniref:5-oxoprolinase subunit B/C family protein n=1 Tax=Comamonas granuli TaxID=290309 RepID=UPI0005AB2089|nr:5-oxoprolinase/urea amidolyase family protein [Comamonas granuli]